MSDHNIFQEIEEDLERQKWENLWKRYGNLVLAGAVAIVLGTAAYTSWHTWMDTKNQKATAQLIGILGQSNPEPEKQVEALRAFAEKNDATSQATLARIEAAILETKAGHVDKAVEIYDSVASNKKADVAFRQLADLLAVQAEMDTGNPAILENRLQPLLAENAPWRYSAMELDGFLAFHEGNKQKAHQIFTELSQDATAPHNLSARAADMLHLTDD